MNKNKRINNKKKVYILLIFEKLNKINFKNKIYKKQIYFKIKVY